MQLKTLFASLRSLFMEDEGSVSLIAAFMIPIFMILILYYQSEMEAVYVYNQSQFVMDMATRAGADTGSAVTDGINAFCTIPWIPEKPDESGYHTCIKVLRANLHTLPAEVADQIEEYITSDQILHLNDTDLRASGYVQMSMELTYSSQIPIFFKEYHYTLKSSSKCTAEQVASAAPSTPAPSGSHSSSNSGSNGWSGSKLTASAGVNQGPSGKETYYNLPMQGVVSIMRNMGFSEAEYPYWVREDGCKMLGDYIMVAADLNTHPRGSVVQSSLGQALVCDTGTFIYLPGGSHWLDIATTW